MSIIVFTGKQGEGKSVSAVMLACKSYLQKDREVYANLAIRDPVTGREAQRWDVEDGFDSLLDVRDACIVMDEGPIYLNARTYKKRSTQRFFAFLAQARKRRNSLIITAQDFEDLDVWVRRQTHFAVTCRIWLRKPWKKDPSGWVDPITGRVRHMPWYLRQEWLQPRDVNLADVTRRERRLSRKLIKFEARYAAAFDSWAEVASMTEQVESVLAGEGSAA
jgi:Zonular occludens toxin (Zot)